ncbi:hypothetical protein BXO87_02255 [Bacillus sp. GZB]|nr:hypothetical protein BXO87_02255 [Bacillus sp. GZB]
MKHAFRILIIILLPVISDSIGIILAYYFDNPNLRINFISVTAAICGYLVRGWWPPKKEVPK